MRFLFLFLFLVAVASAQPAFDVATIRPHTTPIMKVAVEIEGSRITATAMTVRELIAFAYNVPEYQVREGNAAWIRQTRWDIQASAGAVEPTRPQVRVMFQALLAERFGLRLHKGSQEFSVYLMTIAKGGVKLKPPTPLESERSTFHAEGGQWLNAPLDILGNPFPLHLDRPLLNRTGLTGRYDFSLRFRPSPTDAVGIEGESVFTILEEQLGLHVEPGRAELETLVVDGAGQPNEN
jgi:uncharacterized protein (TIGR03435 family)